MKPYDQVALTFARLSEQQQLESSREFLSKMSARRSVRCFSEEPVAWELIENAIRCASLAPSQNPAEDSLLYSFVVKTAQAEWFRRRAQKEYDFFLGNHSNAPIYVFEPHELKALDLVQRYLTTAERKFQRDYRMLEQHWKSHHKPQPESKKAGKQPESEPEPPEQEIEIRFENNETGESMDSFGNEYPPSPDFVFRAIIPGVYDPDHPAYEGPPPP